MSFDFIRPALQQRREQSLFRQRHTIEEDIGGLIKIQGRHFINFSSNDYLGMRGNEDVAQAWVNGLALYGCGSGASPLVTGYTAAHQALEEYLAQQLGRERVLLFNSGFSANQALCEALMKPEVLMKNNTSIHNKQKTIIADKLIHASLIDGAQACGANLRRFKHNDISHLSSLLASTPTDSDTLVVSEGVFSMDGDRADLSGILATLKNSPAWFMLDDAHGFGVLGDTGMGSVEAYELSQQQVPVLMATFGKAVGTAGAFIAGSEELINYLINFSRHYIYSTAMPGAQAHATLASLQLLAAGPQRQQLQQVISQFKQGAAAAGIGLFPSDSAIQPVMMGSPEKALAVSEKLKSMGLWVSAIRYPTVPKGTDRLRITLSAQHQKQDIEALIDAIQIALQTVSPAKGVTV